MIKSFLAPFSAVLLVIRNRQLRQYALIPWLINIVVFFSALFSFGALDRWLMIKLHSVLGTGWWTPLVTWILAILLFAAFGAGLVLSFTYLANLMGGFFAEQLSYHTEKILFNQDIPSPEGSLLEIWSRSMIEEMKGMLFFLGIWLGILCLNLIPVIGTTLFFPVSGLWTMFSLAFEFIAPAAERRAYRFREKRRLVFRRPLQSLSLGAGILILTLIPVVNLFFIPFAVVAGTQWMVENDTPVSA